MFRIALIEVLHDFTHSASLSELSLYLSPTIGSNCAVCLDRIIYMDLNDEIKFTFLNAFEVIGFRFLDGEGEVLWCSVIFHGSLLSN